MNASSIKSRLGSLALALATVAWLGACTDTVYRDRPPFNPPPDAQSGFLGYFTASEKQTTCGNCHVDHQANWDKHNHSNAWADLQASGHAAPYCSGCHAVSQNGNAVDTAAGINKVNSAAYYDVQCENCHGPGEIHVTTPDANTSPLARVNADTLGDPANPNPRGVGTCAECHTGIHEPFVDQWRLSRHGRANTHAYNNVSCQPCHEGRGVLKAWGVNANYKEKNDVITADTLSGLGITCAVCHDPHGNDNPGDLRFPLNDPTLEGNLCMKCHSRRFDPITTSNSSGPHGPQGPVLLGTAGWWPTGADTFPQATTHGNPTANPNLCAGCHVQAFAVTDPVNNSLVLQSTGHLFRPVPCLDPATGVPLPGEDNSCAYNTVERNWSACTKSGCHIDATAAAAALNASRAVIKTLVDQLWVDVDGDRVVDSATDGGYLSLVPKAAFTVNDNFLSVAEGALFNAQLWGEGLTGHPDNSRGTHNPFLAQRQLAATIAAVKSTYGLPAPPAAVQRLMDEGVAKARALGAAVPLRIR
jgi:predicted CXXCH cytochrome family protein